MKRIDVDRWEWFAPRRRALQPIAHLPRYVIDEREFFGITPRSRLDVAGRYRTRWRERWDHNGPWVIVEQVGPEVRYYRPVVVCESENMRAMRLRRQLDYRHPDHRWMI